MIAQVFIITLMFFSFLPLTQYLVLHHVQIFHFKYILRFFLDGLAVIESVTSHNNDLNNFFESRGRRKNVKNTKKNNKILKIPKKVIKY
jgi:hypothetical protein